MLGDAYFVATAVVLPSSTNISDAYFVSTAVVFPSAASSNANFIATSNILLTAFPSNAYFIVTDYGTAGPNPAKRHVWDGSQWVRTPEFVWNGTTWQQVF